MFLEWDVMLLYTLNLFLAWAIFCYGNKLLQSPLAWGHSKLSSEIPTSGMELAYRAVRPLRRIVVWRRQIKRERDGDEPPHELLWLIK